MPTKTIPAKNILVFLPQAAAPVIVAKLAARGYASVAVSTVPEVFDALRSDCYSFAITTRPEIDLLRNIRPIPVVNLEIFFHAEPSRDGLVLTSKRFDGEAFMERIEFLVRPVSARGEQVGGEQVKTMGVQDGKAFRWWALAKNILGPHRHREGLRDVRS